MDSIVWFRKCLRIHDNPSLNCASEESTNIYPVYIIDPNEVEGLSNIRLTFLYECIKDLDSSLKEKYNSRLLVIKGKPLEVLPSLVVKLGISKIYSDKDSEASGESLEKKLRSNLSSLGVQLKMNFHHTLYDIDILLKSWNETPPLSFDVFIKNIDEYGPPASSLKAPKKIPKFNETENGLFLDNILPKDFGVVEYRQGCHLPAARGGETFGLKQLKSTVGNQEWVKKFERGQTNPASIEPDTSLLSPYFSSGCLSTKLFYEELQSSYRSSGGISQDFSATLLSQICWRDYFILLSYSYPNFDKMIGNPICRQIEWDENSEMLAKWKNSQTGFPWIDACMNQLKQTGWLHHIARHSVACFLTRGDLWLHWIEGRDFFKQQLIDYDWSLNSGNWMWMSGSGLDQPILMIYNPVEFPKKYDPNGSFICHYLPVLKNLPKEYIFEPWKAPLEVQKAANCIIGKDYPLPMVNHSVVCKQNILRMRECYRKNKNKPFPNGGPINRSLDGDNNSTINCLKRKRDELLSLLAKRSHTYSNHVRTKYNESTQENTNENDYSQSTSSPSPSPSPSLSPSSSPPPPSSSPPPSSHLPVLNTTNQAQ